MRVTRPALMQLVHALMRPGVPSTSARTRWMFGSHRRLFRLCENVTDLPNHGFLPQMSQTAAIGATRLPERSQLPGDLLQLLVQRVLADRPRPREGEASIRTVERRHRLPEVAEVGLDRVRRVEHARERHLELVHEGLRLGARVHDVDPEELDPVAELVMRRDETGHLLPAGRAPRSPEVDEHRRPLQLGQQPLERVRVHRGQRVGEHREQRGLGGVVGRDLPGGRGIHLLAVARDEEKEPGHDGDEASRGHTWMVEPFTNVPGSPSTLALDSPVLHVDRKLATRRTGLREKGDEAHVILAGMGIGTVGDLLRHYPRRYIDRSAVERVRDLRVGEQTTVIARVHATVKRLTRRRQSMVTVTISDGTGKLDLTFFNQPWAAGIYKEGLELAVSLRKHRLGSERSGIAHRADGALTDRLLATLPFEPTKAQTRAIEEVGAAMAAGRPMNVLLQGDVGSGKTLVAVSACLVAIQSGHQAGIMAPTEVLATQHARSVAALLAGVGAIDLLERGSSGAPHGQGSLLEELAVTPSEDDPITYALLTAAVTGKDRARILAGVAGGGVDLVIGTHALVQEAVSFADFSLAVVDEQHRFGLHQRMALRGKGEGDIDVVIMTATPIPRTLALTYYGDLDVVVLDEMPKGRQPIGTAAARSDEERAAAYDLVRREVREGRQAFVVCAAIDEGNRSQVRAAEAEAKRLATEIFPDLRLALLHGRMRPKDKDRVMDDFRTGRCDVLISTTVIEVGVDVPNATVMLVENAERFGLAQLHQLRGRIGRGEHASFCILFDESTPDNEDV